MVQSYSYKNIGLYICISHGELIQETSITQLLYVHKEHSLLLIRPLKNVFTASHRSIALKTPGFGKTVNILHYTLILPSFGLIFFISKLSVLIFNNRSGNVLNKGRYS